MIRELERAAKNQKCAQIFSSGIFIQVIYKRGKPMGAVKAFTNGNYHCQSLMTDVIICHS